MIDTALIDETEQEHGDASSEPQESATPTDSAVQEKEPLELLLDEMDAMKSRIAQLEDALSSHGHSINLDTDQIVDLALQKINALIRARLGRV